MPRLSQEKINEVRSSVDIVDVMGQYLSLTKKGRSYMALCPFHDDTNPSLNISPDKQIYKCFVCGSGGNVFTFLQNYLHISYIDAVKQVAQIGHVDLGDYDLTSKKEPVRQELVPLYEMNEEAGHIYSYYLNTKLGIEAKNYLIERGFNDEIIEHFSIGYAPIDSILYRTFENKYDEIDMVKSGLVIESNQHYDRFNDRIMFPIHNSDGKIIGFSGRIYKVTQNDNKYVNSPESDIFIKGETLYNYHRCRESVHKAGFVYLLEGFMDVIALYKAGLENSVALMGTALTKDHIRMLKRLTSTVYVCLDSDQPGLQAASKVAQSLMKEKMEVKIIRLPEGKDPDEIYQQQGSEGLVAALKKTMLPIEFQMNFRYQEIDSGNYDDRKRFLDEMCELISPIEDEVDKDYYIHRLADLSQFSETIIKQRLNGIETQNKPVYHEVKKTIKLIDKYNAAERELLFYMLNSKEVALKYEAKVGFMYNDSYRIIASYIVDYYRNNDKLEIADFINRLPKEDLVDCVTDIATLSLPLPYDDKAIDDYIKTISLNAKKMKKEQLLEQFRYVLDPYKKSEILKEIVDLEKEE